MAETHLQFNHSADDRFGHSFRLVCFRGLSSGTSPSLHLRSHESYQLPAPVHHRLLHLLRLWPCLLSPFRHHLRRPCRPLDGYCTVSVRTILVRQPSSRTARRTLAKTDMDFFNNANRIDFNALVIPLDTMFHGATAKPSQRALLDLGCRTMYADISNNNYVSPKVHIYLGNWMAKRVRLSAESVIRLKVQW